MSKKIIATCLLIMFCISINSHNKKKIAGPCIEWETETHYDVVWVSTGLILVPVLTSYTEEVCVRRHTT